MVNWSYRGHRNIPARRGTGDIRLMPKEENMKLYKRIAAFAAGAATLTAAIPDSIPAVAAGPAKADVAEYHEVDANWAKLLQYSLHFYDANMCGTDVEGKNRLPWRGNCHVYDAKVPLRPMDEQEVGTNLSEAFIEKYKDILDPDGDGTVDVSGGYHDAGDHVKFGLPEAYAASAVSWGYYEFRDSYEAAEQTEHIETLCRHFCDYFMRSTFRDKSGKVIAFC